MDIDLQRSGTIKTGRLRLVLKPSVEQLLGGIVARAELQGAVVQDLSIEHLHVQKRSHSALKHSFLRR